MLRLTKKYKYKVSDIPHPLLLLDGYVRLKKGTLIEQGDKFL